MTTLSGQQVNTLWYQNLWAALIFFTRLPFWRLYQPPQASYKTVVEFWPLSAWLTGGIMAAVLYCGSFIFPWAVAVVLAIGMRLLVTGALHEDGLADFFDGMGGGTSRERILAIMKDSHIGTYGVIGLVIYHLLLAACLYSMQPRLAALAVLAAGPFARLVSCTLIMLLPYARRADEAKNKTIYRAMSIQAVISVVLQGLLPMVLVLWSTRMSWPVIIVAPCLVLLLLYWLIRRKIGGYTGDCCGAVCLLVELSIYLVINSLLFLE